MGDGLIYAFLLDGAGGGRLLTWEEVQQWQAGDGLLWLHLNFSEPDTLHWLRSDSGLDELVVDALVADDTRPRAASLKGGLLMSLRGVNMNPGADPEDMVSIRLWITEQRIVSTRRRRLLSVDDMVQSLRHGDGPKDSGEFVATLCDCLSRRMSDVIDQAEDSVDQLEESVLVAERRVLRSELAALRRQTIALRRYISPQREALNRLQSESLPWFGERSRLRVREIADRMVQFVDALDSVRDRAAVTQEELASQLSEEANRRMYLLSVVAAVFLPLGFLTGLMGINIGGMPGVENSQAFWLFSGVLTLLIVAEVLYFRYNKWL